MIVSSQFSGLNLGPVDSIVYEHCPIPNESYTRLMDAMNVTNVQSLKISYGTTEDGRPLLPNQVTYCVSIKILDSLPPSHESMFNVLSTIKCD